MPGNWGRGIIGPNIALDGLVVYYDFSNPKCYSTGDTVNNLMPIYPNITASLSGSGVSRPTLVSNTYLNFNRLNENYMYYTLPSMGPSFTSILIASSPTSTWQATNTNVSSLIYAANASNPVSGYRFITNPSTISWDIESNSGGNSYSNALSTQTPTPLTSLHYYYLSFNNTTGNYLCGIDTNSPSSGTILVPSNRGTSINTSVYFSRYHPLVTANFTARWLNSNIYYHMYYNRALSINEITQTYYALKYKYGLS